MLCARNSFSVLDSFDPPPPNESSERSFPHSNTVKKGAPRDATLVPSKLQRHPGPHCDNRRPCNPLPRQNGPTTKRGVVEARGRKNTVDHRDNRPRDCPTNLPPRLQHQPIESRGVCHPPPRPCSVLIDPCLTSTPLSCSANELNVQLKKEIFGMLQKPLPAACPDKPVSTSHPVGTPTPIPSKKDAPRPVSIPNRSNPCTVERHDVMSSKSTQRIGGREEAPRAQEVVSCTPIDARAASGTPRTPEVISCTPTDASALLDPAEKLNVSLPAPPGLSKPSGRGRRLHHRGRGSTRPAANGERGLNQVVQDSNFERYNGPVAATRVISPPPSGATPNPVKLPARKDAQRVPPSPTISTSSLSEDLSGSSSVLFSSDTTFTSVDSNVSSKVSQYQYHRIPPNICRNWLNGYPCFMVPCRYRHVRPDQPTKPTPSPTASPHSSDVPKTPVRTCDQKNEPISRKHDPPSRNAEPPQRPEPLYATTIADHIKVRFDQGFEVREVMTGFESRWVHLGNIAGTVTSVELNKLLAPYNVDNVTIPESSGKPVTAKVQFASSADAIKAVTDLNGTEFAERTINAKLAINNSIRGSTVLIDTDVQLVWQCPSRVGYAGYDTLKEAKVAIDSLHGFPMEYSVVSAQLYEGIPCVGAYNVIFKHLPASVNEQSLRKFANSKAVMLGRPNYQSLGKAVKSIRSRLEEYGTVAAFDIIPPPYKDGRVKAWARFTSPAEARAAQEDFDHRRPSSIGLTFISCRHVLSVSHVLTAASYRNMREDIGWLRWSWQRRYGPIVSIRERVKENADDDTPAYIRLSSEQPELLSSLKYEFEQLLHGETIMFDKKPLWDDFLVAQAGHTYIAQVHARYPGVQIQVQKDRRAISLWGPIVVRHRARQDIVRKVMELKAQQPWRIPLSGKLLGISRSVEFSTLRELLGPENCFLDIAERVLVVRGNDLAFRTACSAVQDAQSRQGDGSQESDSICPVCFGEAVVPVSLACGHQWCRACLTGYLTSAVENKTFPLRCLGNDATCTQCIPLGLSRKLLSAADFSAVIEAAFWVYVHGRPDEFHHCPTPDCTQVYRSAPPNAVLQCPSCLVRICPACRIESHDGMTCEERDVAEDKLFNEWTSSHDVKSCPGCKAPIERSEGCNHMTCTRCQTHSCWECLATFPRGQGIYEHMRVQHGSIGL